MLVRDLLENHKAELTAAERRLVPFLRDDSLAIELQSITKLAEAAQVSTPTVIRLARKLGFDGFPSLQSAIRAELAERIKQPLAKLEARAPKGQDDHIVNIAAHMLVQNVNQTLAQLDFNAFDEVAALLGNSENSIHLIGGRITWPVAYHFANHLGMARFGVNLLNSSQSAWPQTILDMDEKSILVVFDITRYERMMERLAEISAAQGAKILLFTDQWGSPIEKIADYCFRATGEAPSSWDSTVALAFLVETLVAAIQNQVPEECANRIRQIEEMIGATEIFRRS